MMNYFVKCYQQATSLAIIMTESQITDRIFRHFSREIQNLWMARNIKTVKNATELLNSFEHRDTVESGNYDMASRAHNPRETGRLVNGVAPPRRRDYNRERQMVGVNVLSKENRVESNGNAPVVAQANNDVQMTQGN